MFFTTEDSSRCNLDSNLGCTSWLHLGKWLLLSSETPWGSTRPSLGSEHGAYQSELCKEQFVLSSQRQQTYKRKPCGRLLRGASGAKVSPEAWTWVRPSCTSRCIQKQGALVARVCIVEFNMPWSKVPLLVSPFVRWVNWGKRPGF